LGVIFIKSGDTERVLTQTLFQAGNVVNLTGCTVTFNMRGSGGIVISSPATIVSPPTNGQVSYQFQASTFPVQGNYQAVWDVTFSDGGRISFPEGGFLNIRVLETI
jgi:hypothetical protein